MNENAKYILVTGGTGFIGYSLINTLVEENYTPILMIRKTSSLKRIANILDRVKVVVVDFSQKTSLRKCVKSLKEQNITLTATIYGLGTVRENSWQAFEEVNTNYLRYFYEAVWEEDYTLGSFIFLSSLSIHGPSDDLSRIVITTSEANPVSPYALSKLKAEAYLQKTCNNYTIIRPAVVIGEYDTEMMFFFKMEYKRFRIFLGDKRQKIGFIHAKDLSYQIISYIPEKEGRRIVLGCSHNHSTQAFLDMISEVYDKKKKIVVTLPKRLLLLIAGISEKIFSMLCRGKLLEFSTYRIKELTSKNWASDTSDFDLAMKRMNIKNPTLKERVKQSATWYLENNWMKG